MEALVYASDTGYTQSFPIRAIKVTDTGVVWVYAGSYGTFYTDKYLRSPRSDGHWIRLKDSNILYYQTILSIAAAIDEYLP
ncbi:MAG: hypothetical protein IJ654_07100 [Bacteroidales bacterium]|nr:hypothetical protein [Bacteroidales bacterium]